MKFGVGQSVKRTEDIRLITGQGQYTDDLRFERETHTAFLRSPYAHARIKSLDTSAAKNAPGVVAVLTQADVDAFGAGAMPNQTPLVSRDGKPPIGGVAILIRGSTRLVPSGLTQQSLVGCLVSKVL